MNEEQLFLVCICIYHRAYPHPTCHDRIRYFQLMDAIVTQIVLDRRGLTDDFESKFGVSVNQLVNKLVDQDRVNAVQDELKSLRHQVETLTKEKFALEHETEGTYL